MIHRDEYWSHAEDAASHLGTMGAYPVDLVLEGGSGMAGLGEELLPGAKRIELDAAPFWPAAKVPGHAPEALYGRIGEHHVLVLAGRVHVYEGYTPLEAGFPAAVAKALEARLLVVLNSAGGLNQHFAVGSMMVHTGFINFQGDNALAHVLSPDAGELFVDPNPTYHRQHSELLYKALSASGQAVHQGTYLAVRGPIYETRSELVMMRGFGADAIGMSTVPEVSVAHWLGLPAVGLSVITNECFGTEQVGHGAVVKAGQLAMPRLAAGLKQFVEQVKL